MDVLWSHVVVSEVTKSNNACAVLHIYLVSRSTFSKGAWWVGHTQPEWLVLQPQKRLWESQQGFGNSQYSFPWWRLAQLKRWSSVRKWSKIWWLWPTLAEVSPSFSPPLPLLVSIISMGLIQNHIHLSQNHLLPQWQLSPRNYTIKKKKCEEII